MFEESKKQLQLWSDYLRAIANRGGTNVCKLLLWRLFETLSLTIPGFIIVLLFPIKEDNIYNWHSGIWHGWFALCNMIISLISSDVLYMSPNGTQSYYICWWIFCIWGILALLGLYFANVLSIRENRIKNFVSPFLSKEQNKVLQTHNDEEGKPRGNNNQNLNKREIRVFISSTFHDMQKERDYLMVHIFPKLQEVAKSRNVTFIPVDLRWGITEEESKSGKVIELCLQEIDNAIPFFIGIIGQRYGWQPSVDEFYKGSLLKERYPWVEEDLKQGLSVTEIEMQYGVLRRKELINAVFFTTSGTIDTATYSDKEEDVRLSSLKLNIIKDGRYPIITVLSPEQFGNEVYDLFLRYLNQYFPVSNQHLDEYGKISLTSDYSIREYITGYLNKAGKKLSEQHLNLIINHPLSKNQTVLKALLNELLIFGQFDKLDDYIAYWLEAKSPVEFYVKILEQAESRYGKRQVRTFFSILAVSDKSIAVKDLLKMAEVGDEDTLGGSDFSIYGEKSLGRKIINCFDLRNLTKKPFDLYFSEYLQKDGDNKVFLSHKYMKHAVISKYLSSNKEIKKYIRYEHKATDNAKDGFRLNP